MTLRAVRKVAQARRYLMASPDKFTPIGVKLLLATWRKSRNAPLAFAIAQRSASRLHQMETVVPGADVARLHTRKRGTMSDRYVWLLWSLALLVPWLLAYAAFPSQRSAMIWASLFTTPFGLTEPIFVPQYWSPPSLFDLARTTGFDIESFIFAFGIGGIGAVVYNLATGRRLAMLAAPERRLRRHAFHNWSLALPFISFPVLYLLDWNPIYPAIVALVLGAAAAIWCRTDLVRKTWIGSLLFVAYYSVFLLGVEWTMPGYISRVWNLSALSGVRIVGMPIEEVLFAAAFGAYWSGVYDHFTWRALTDSEPSRYAQPNQGSSP